jgi:exopolysaccharide production protein ExoZ
MQRQLVSVQYLRGIAALLVVLAHAAAHPLTDVPLLLERFGQAGVVLFFVISGFIMVTVTGDGRFSPREFLARRIVRVVPLYWLMTTLTALLAVGAPALFHTTITTWPHYLQSLLFIPHEAPGRGGTSPLLSLGWTLNYEMFFYLVFALCGVVGLRTRIALISAIFLGLATFGQLAPSGDTLVGFYTNMIMLPFVAGTLLAYAHRRGWLDRWSNRQAALVALAALAAGLWTFTMVPERPTTLTVVLGLTVAAIGLLASGLATEGRPPRIAPLEALGNASYSLYLTHMFAIGALVAIAARLLPQWNDLAYVALVGLAIALSAALGLVVHHGIEKPLLALMRGKPRRAPPAATISPA